MIERISSDGVGCSVVRQRHSRHVFVTAEPEVGGNLHQQTLNALQMIRSVVQQQSAGTAIVQQTVFLHDEDNLEDCRRAVQQFYGSEMPATTYIFQAPCSQRLMAIEAMGLAAQAGQIQVQRYSDRKVVARHDGITWLHVADMRPETAAAAVYDRAASMFALAAGELRQCGLQYGQVVRTWLYLGDIVGDQAGKQRYKELNRARADFYRDIQFSGRPVSAADPRPTFPASTGIGTSEQDMVMSGIAVSSERDDLAIVPLENPAQTSAFHYGERYGRESPRFARGLVIADGDSAMIFVSGTASITDSETRFVGDVLGQTRQTLDNIARLIGEDNMQRHGLPGLGATLDDLAIARIYVKRQDDCPVVRPECQSRLGQSPMVFAQADVCRPELLVEIEGIAFSREIGA